jgi:hypothetical protein
MYNLFPISPYAMYKTANMVLSITILSIVRTYNISLVTSNESFSYQVICTILAV